MVLGRFAAVYTGFVKDIAELEALYDDLESDRVERKASASDTDKIQQTICAFANDLAGHDQPGVLFLGVHDNGQCANLTITDKLLVDLSQIRRQGNILPLPEMAVEKKRIRDCEVIVVTVNPSLSPPVRFKGQVWVRVGPSRAIASIDEERRLSEKRRYKDPSFDLWGVPSANLSDLDLEFFRTTFLPSMVAPEIIDSNHRSIEHQLQSLHFLRLEFPQPTIAGLLTVGKIPRDFLPGAYTHFLRIAGTTLDGAMRNDHELDGHILRVCQQADDLFRLHIDNSVSYTETDIEVRRPDYPLAAIQQLFRNAILHRDYQLSHAPIRLYWFDDRIEIHSPGGPYGAVNQTNFGSPGITDYRNPQLATSMKALGLVQTFGSGIAIARAQLKKNGNPDLEFQVSSSHIAAIVRRAA